MYVGPCSNGSVSDMAASTSTRSVFDAVVGQDSAIEALRALASSPAHAYLLVGPPGCGKDTAARAFAALRLQGSEDPSGRVADLVMRGIHVDVRELEREGSALSIDTVRDEIVKPTHNSAVEADRRITIAFEFHLLSDSARPALLKTLEEPDGRNEIILVADDVPPNMATIASRCVRINFAPVPDELIVSVLMDEGVSHEKASELAFVAAGDLDRARVLSADTELSERIAFFQNVPHRLDGRLSTAIGLVAEITMAIEAALEPYKLKHQAEIEELDERAKQLGERGGGRAKVNERHKRELRRFRTDELRSGLRVLSLVYREAIAALGSEAPPHEVIAYSDAVHAIRLVNENLGRNTNERLQLENLLLNLPSLRRE